MSNHNNTCLSLGGLLFVIGFLMQGAEMVMFGNVLMIIGAILVGIALVNKLFNQHNNPEQTKNTSSTQNITDVTNIVYKKSLEAYIDVLRETAIEYNQLHNFEINLTSIKEKISDLQIKYGYALQKLENRSIVLMAILLYYLGNADKLISIYTNAKPTNEQYEFILKCVINDLENDIEEFENTDIPFYIKEIVDGYFFWNAKNS